MTEHEEILEAYKEYFEDLLTVTNKKTTLEENKDTVQKVEREFKDIIDRGKKQKPKKTNPEVVGTVVKELKRKKARDTYGWNNEMIMDGGLEMVESIRKMADVIQEKGETPNPWNYMTIKSTHKQGPKQDLGNKRGLFQTNVVSKTYEKIIDKDSELTFDRNQNGGQKLRGDCG